MRMRHTPYRDAFEQMLKDSADRFRIIPSARVWHSLYNNLHPGKIWPSVPACFFFTVWLLFFALPESEKTKNAESGAISHGKALNVESTNRHSITQLERGSSSSSKLAFYSKNNLPYISANKEPQENDGSAQNGTDQILFRSFRRNPFSLLQLKDDIKAKQSAVEGLTVSTENAKRSNPNEYSFNEKRESWMDRFAYQIYATPAIGFRAIAQNSDHYSEASFDQSARSGQLALQYPSRSIEAGGSVYYRYSDLMRFKAGVQFNLFQFSNENSAIASKPEDLSYQNINSLVGEIPAASSISYQVSVPVGADLKIADAGDLSWYAGATVQPTIIMNGEYNSLSPAASVYEQTPYRRWNINGGIETFISYKITGNVFLNAGPQFRYQLLSSYRNEYIYRERMYNLGLKMGISSRF